MSKYRSLSAGHTYTTHGQRTEKLAILASALSFAGCASAFVTRFLSALDQRYAFVVIRSVRLDFCALSSTHECTRPKDARQRAERAAPTPDTRRARWTNHGQTCLSTCWHVCRLRCSRRIESSSCGSGTSGSFSWVATWSCALVAALHVTAVAVRWMRGACADHSFRVLATRCTFVGFFNMCSPVYAQRASNTLCIHC